jgi:hypothetical protein
MQVFRENEQPTRYRYVIWRENYENSDEKTGKRAKKENQIKTPGTSYKINPPASKIDTLATVQRIVFSFCSSLTGALSFSSLGFLLSGDSSLTLWR